MMNFARHKIASLLVASAIATLLMACASEPPLQPGVPKTVNGVTIAPYEFYEECLHLDVGDRLDYRFESEQPVAFNIHYHEAKLVLQPVTKTGLTSDIGIFTPVIAQDYCLMWEAGPDGAVLSYRIMLRRPRPSSPSMTRMRELDLP